MKSAGVYQVSHDWERGGSGMLPRYEHQVAVDSVLLPLLSMWPSHNVQPLHAKFPSAHSRGSQVFFSGPFSLCRSRTQDYVARTQSLRVYPLYWGLSQRREFMFWALKKMTSIWEWRKFGDQKENIIFMDSSKKKQKKNCFHLGISSWHFNLHGFPNSDFWEKSVKKSEK